jgi:ketosteroid isomerase-like protein
MHLFGALAAAATLASACPPVAASYDVEEDARKVRAVLSVIDRDVTDTSIYVDDVVHMGQDSRPITNREALTRALAAEATHGRAEMKHELVSIHSYPDMVLTRGRVTGSWRPAAGGAGVPFETNNMITFRRMPDGSLKVWHVIFNRVDLSRYPTP